MKGLAFRKLSRTSSHRNHLLRNLVSSLIQHERISTTVAKAKEAAREAEKIITLGKRGSVQAGYGTRGYLYSQQETLPKLQELAQRYANAPAATHASICTATGRATMRHVPSSSLSTTHSTCACR